MLTADHVAAGSRHLVESANGTHDVTAVLRSHEPGVDLAVLNLSEPVVGLRPLGYARVPEPGRRGVRVHGSGVPAVDEG